MKKFLFYFLFTTNMLSQTYSVDTLINSALQHDLTLPQLQHQLSILSLQRKSVFASYLPTIDMAIHSQHQSELPELSPALLGIQTNAPSREIGVKDQFEGVVQLNWLIFSGFKRKSASESLDNAAQSALFQKRFKKKQIPAIIRTLSYQILSYETGLKALTASYNRIKINLERAQKLLNNGFATALDTLEFSSRLSELQLEMQSYQKLKKESLVTLRLLTGITDISDIHFNESVTPLPAIESIPHDLSKNYAVKMIDFKKKDLEIRKDKHRSAFYPEIYAFGGYYYGRPGVNFFSDQWMNYWKVGIQFKFNLFKWGSDKRQIQQDNLAIQINSLQQQHTLREEKINFEKYLIALKDINHKLDILNRLENQKTEKLALTTQQWENGQKAAADVMSAEQELTRVVLQKKNFRYQFQIIYEAIKIILNQ